MAEMKKAENQNSVMALLQQPSMLAQLRMALPKHVTPERLARIVMTSLRQTPELLRCTRESLLGSIMGAAQLGLEPGVLGQCWLIPYKGVATLVVGYRGMTQLAWRSGQIASIAGRAVFEGDHFAFDFGADKLEHRPFGQTDPDKLTHAYAVIHTTAGGRLWDVMSREEIERVRERSAAGRKGPWLSDYSEMAKKTVLKRLFKLAPSSVEMQRAEEIDNAADTGSPQGLEFDIPLDALDGEVIADAVTGTSSAPPTPEGPEALLHLEGAIAARAEEFETPSKARTQIVAALQKEFGKLSDLRGAKLAEAIKAVGIIKVDVEKS
jgi:recombination protein RecT